jgi:hypothetical protein
MTTITLAKTSTASHQSVRADFRDATSDQVRSDATDTFYRPCGFDYVDKNDSCTNDLSAKNSISRTEFPLDYWFFRTVRDCCAVPTRWLVLDFSVGIGSGCPDLDSQYANYPGYGQTPSQPPAITGCVDNLEVRFSADNVFNSRAMATPVRMLIDAPDLTKSGNLQGNVKWRLDFVNPLTIMRNPDGTTTIETVEATAELWTIGRNGRKDTKLGTYSMPFAVTLKPI